MGKRFHNEVEIKESDEAPNEDRTFWKVSETSGGIPKKSILKRTKAPLFQVGYFFVNIQWLDTFST